MREIDYEALLEEQARRRIAVPSRRSRARPTDEEQLRMYARRQGRLEEIWRSWGVVRIERADDLAPRSEGDVPADGSPHEGASRPIR